MEEASHEKNILNKDNRNERTIKVHKIITLKISMSIIFHLMKKQKNSGF